MPVSTYNDITARKKAEENLRTHKERLYNILEGTNVGTWEWNVKTGETIFNEKWANIIGYTLKEISPVSIDTWMKFAHPEDLEKSNALLEKHFNGELNYYHFESRMKHKDGSWIWVLDRGKVITWDDDGKPLWVFGTHQDITERKRAEEALRESKTHLQGLFKTMAEGMIFIAPDGQIVQANPAAERILGLKCSDIKARNYVAPEWEILRPDGTPMPPEEMAGPRALKERRPAKNVVMGVKRPDDSISWINVSAAPLINEAGELEGVVGTFADITERKKLEEEIKHLNLVLRAIRNVNQLIVKEKDRDKLLQSTCDNLTENRGYYDIWIALLDENKKLVTAAESGLSKNFSKIVKKLKRGELTLCGQRAMKKSKTVIIDDPLKSCKDCPLSKEYKGRAAIVSLLKYRGKVYGLICASILPHFTIDKEEQDLFQEVANDIALALHSIELEQKHKRAEEEKEKLQAQLVHSEKMAGIGTLTSGIAHEFNNLLQIMRGHAEFAHVTEKPEDMKEALGIVKKTSDRVSKIIRDLLSFSRDETLEKELCDITVPLETVLSLIEEQIRKHNIEIVREYERVPRIEMDKAEIQQVFLNIATNARDAMLPEGGKLEIAVRKAEDYVKVSFHDTGKGIDKKTLNRVFEPFYTTKGAIGGNETIVGTGLGLWVSYGIVRRHGGTVEIESEKEKGTTFTVSLPVKDAWIKKKNTK